ncbi:LysR family transcriptional regulator [Rhizobium sp. BG4]|uniref:LysR family transcriptional regulator n=1 Tax=Rhizobium sp. BG4 TaxID=2613770 RepID=UPI00193E7ACB|nr:LysR family transcriptional regulator [Rhizobium sp. BG4]QRM47239.1 LysR family transcriptional regulator [Rhizobium sp. BG4]
MDLSSIEIFLAVARESSVTRAAAELGRVPSNVTTRVQQLEEDLGASLFSRDGKKMTLTAKGEVFSKYATRLLALALEARQAVGPFAPSGELRVGTMESTAASRLPTALAEFNRMWPEVSLQLKLGASQELLSEVVRGTLDCALVARPPKQVADAIAFEKDVSKLDARSVFSEDLLVVLPLGHKPIKNASDLRVSGVAALEPGCTYRRAAERWLEHSSVRTIEHGSYHAIMASISTGDIAGVMPRSVYDLMPHAASTMPISLGAIETILVSRKDHQPQSLAAFEKVLSSTRDINRHHST